MVEKSRLRLIEKALVFSGLSYSVSVDTNLIGIFLNHLVACPFYPFRIDVFNFKLRHDVVVVEKKLYGE